MNALVLAFNLWAGAEAVRVDVEHPPQGQFARMARFREKFRAAAIGRHHAALAVVDPWLEELERKLLGELLREMREYPPAVGADLIWDRNNPALRKREPRK